MRPLFALAILTLAVPFAGAQCRTVTGRVLYQQPAQVQVVEQIVTPVLTPVLVAQPVLIDPRISYLYAGGSYYPPQAQAMPCAQAQPAPRIKPKSEPAPCPAVNEDAIVEKLFLKLQQNNGAKPPPVPGMSAQKVSFTPALARTYVDVLASNCMECHSSKAMGGLAIFDAQGFLAKNVDFDAIWKAIDDGRMPPANRPRISRQDMQILRRDFQRAGAASLPVLLARR